MLQRAPARGAPRAQRPSRDDPPGGGARALVGAAVVARRSRRSNRRDRRQFRRQGGVPAAAAASALRAPSPARPAAASAGRPSWGPAGRRRRAPRPAPPRRIKRAMQRRRPWSRARTRTRSSRDRAIRPASRSSPGGAPTGTRAPRMGTPRRAGPRSVHVQSATSAAAPPESGASAPAAGPGRGHRPRARPRQDLGTTCRESAGAPRNARTKHSYSWLVDLAPRCPRRRRCSRASPGRAAGSAIRRVHARPRRAGWFRARPTMPDGRERRGESGGGSGPGRWAPRSGRLPGRRAPRRIPNFEAAVRSPAAARSSPSRSTFRSRTRFQAAPCSSASAAQGVGGRPAAPRSRRAKSAERITPSPARAQRAGSLETGRQDLRAGERDRPRACAERGILRGRSGGTPAPARTVQHGLNVLQPSAEDENPAPEYPWVGAVAPRLRGRAPADGLERLCEARGQR